MRAPTKGNKIVAAARPAEQQVGAPGALREQVADAGAKGAEQILRCSVAERRRARRSAGPAVWREL